MNTSLHNYQRRVAQHIVDHPASAVFLHVGLGKTAATLTALLAADDAISILVVAPKKVAEETWLAERDLWAPELTMRVITGNPKQRMSGVLSPERVHVVSFDNVEWLVKTFGAKWPYNVLVLDESQKVKDPSTNRFKALKKVRHLFDRVILLSATPASESRLGLWSQYFLADGGQRLGKTFTSYKEAFFESDYMGWSTTIRRGAEEKINARIADITIAMKADDYLDLPERIDIVNPISLPNMPQYEQMERDYLLPLKNGAVTAVNAAVLFGKLCQLSSGCIYDEDRVTHTLHTAKMDALTELVDSANGNPVLVFYAYQHERERLLTIKGAEPLDVKKWNAGLQRVAIAHPKSAGAGLNLQHGGSVMVWFSLPASGDLYTQACGRLHRQGQKETVIIHHLIATGTIDEEIMALLQGKHASEQAFFEALRSRA